MDLCQLCEPGPLSPHNHVDRDEYGNGPSLRTRTRSIVATIVMVAVLVTACGGAGLDEQQSELVAIANRNAPLLQLTSNLASTQMLDSRTGQITDLREVVTGDRPVLMWYWAPN